MCVWSATPEATAYLLALCTLRLASPRDGVTHPGHPSRPCTPLAPHSIRIGTHPPVPPPGPRHTIGVCVHRWYVPGGPLCPLVHRSPSRWLDWPWLDPFLVLPPPPLFWLRLEGALKTLSVDFLSFSLAALAVARSKSPHGRCSQTDLSAPSNSSQNGGK